MLETQDSTLKTLSWRLPRDRAITLDQPRLMGIVNVTPDSFSDGGALPSVQAAVEYALRLVDGGAAIVDIGGESTRPGADRVDDDAQVQRTAGVVEGVRRRSDVAISIDTTRAAVAEAAIHAGADIINDVSAGLEDEGMFPLAARTGCGLVLMHRLRSPESDSYSDRYDEPPQYDDVTATVRRFLGERAKAAEDAGVDPRSIVIDPGLGFGKTVDQNFQLVRDAGSLVSLGYPVLSAASRKSFLGAASGVTDPRGRVAESVAVTVAHYAAGLRLFRVHDVAAHRRALAVVTRLGLQALHGP